MVRELDLAAVVGTIVRPDGSVRRSRRDGRCSARGRLDDLAAWLEAVQGSAPPRALDGVRMLVLAGDHGVAAAGVSTRAEGATADLVRDLASGRSPVAVLAAELGVELRVAALSVDDDLTGLPAQVTTHAVRRGSGAVHREPALTREEAEAAVMAGMELADDAADAGCDLLVLAAVGRGAGVPAAALVGMLTRNDASVVTSRGGSIDDALWMRRCAAVRDTIRRGRPVMGDYVELLATVGGADLAAATGVLLQCAARRTPVLLDGVVTAAAALVAQRIAFRCVDWWVAGHRSPERAHDLALDRLALRPLLDLAIRAQDGTGALLAVPVVRAAAAGAT